MAYIKPEHENYNRVAGSYADLEERGLMSTLMGNSIDSSSNFGNVRGTTQKILGDAHKAGRAALLENPHFNNYRHLKDMGYSHAEAAEKAGMTEEYASELVDLGKLLL